jgi:DNA (cytosine-5)-methyltransferase 1
MRSVELFTGAGGLAIGSHLAGFEHALLAEWNKDACETLRENAARAALPGTSTWNVVQGDVRAIKYGGLGTIDLVAGGVPCQPFSIGGKHQGMSDPRDMFPEFVRAVRELRPRAFIVENVKGLLRESFSTYFGYVLLQLSFPTIARKPSESWLDHLRRLERAKTSGAKAEPRYNVVFELLNAADYGVPQTRERVFIVGFRSDLGIEWSFPQRTHSREALLRDQFVTGDYWRRHGLRRPAAFKQARSESSSLLRTAELFPLEPWRTVRDATRDLPTPKTREEAAEVANHRLNPGAKQYTGHTGSPLDLPAKTLKAGVHGVPGGENMVVLPNGRVRYFTVREAARLQTFPDTWRFRGSWSEAMRQLGNAVPVALAQVVATKVAAKIKS